MLCWVAVPLALSRASLPGPSGIILVHADDLGYGDLGCTGHPTSETPNIDRVGREGARFTQFYSAAPVCSPSRAGLLTGRHPAAIGVYCANSTDQCAAPNDEGCCNGVWLPGMPGGVPQSTPTFASLLRATGYKTAAIGKWHLGGVEKHHPLAYGFDEYFGVPHGLGACPVGDCFCGHPGEGNEPCAIAGQPDWAPCPLFANKSIIAQPADLLSLSASYIQAATDFISRSAGGKFFVYYASHHVHSPQFAGPAATNSTRRGRFGDSLKELDDAVGDLLFALERHSVVENTLVMILSDNGPSLRNTVRGGSAGLLRCGKGTTFEGGSLVPLLIRWPARVPPAIIVRDVVSSLDLLPTVVSIAGGQLPAQFDGFVAPDLLFDGVPGTSPRNNTLVYFPQFPQQNRGVYGGIYAARAGRWKAHFVLQGSLQSGENNTDYMCGPRQPYVVLETPLLFDLWLDPAEQYPVTISDPSYTTGIFAATAVAEVHSRTWVWGPSPLLNAGAFDKSLQPCARPGCSPFPSCCRTPPTPATKCDLEPKTMYLYPD